MNNKKILITGGLGFIGSNLAIKLVELYNEVTIIDNLDPNGGGNKYNINPIKDKINLIGGDIKDRRIIERAIEGKEYIFNLAGQVSHVSSIEGGALEDLETNCKTSLTLLEACRTKNPNSKILYTGTRGQYGEIITLPVNENHPQRPKDINDIHKMAAENYHLIYNKVHKLWTTCLRLTNIYGPRHQMLDPSRGFIGHFVKMAIDNKSIKLFGGGKQVRDMCYVDDVVDAMIKTIQTEKAEGKVFNVASGNGFSLEEIAKLILNISKKGKIEITPYEGEYKAAEIGDYIGDITKIKSIVGWEPKTNLKEGLEKMIKYYQENKEHYW